MGLPSALSITEALGSVQSLTCVLCCTSGVGESANDGSREVWSGILELKSTSLDGSGGRKWVKCKKGAEMKPGTSTSCGHPPWSWPRLRPCDLLRAVLILVSMLVLVIAVIAAAPAPAEREEEGSGRGRETAVGDAVVIVLVDSTAGSIIWDYWFCLRLMSSARAFLVVAVAPPLYLLSWGSCSSLVGGLCSGGLD